MSQNDLILSHSAASSSRNGSVVVVAAENRRRQSRGKKKSGGEEEEEEEEDAELRTPMLPSLQNHHPTANTARHMANGEFTKGGGTVSSDGAVWGCVSVISGVGYVCVSALWARIENKADRHSRVLRAKY